MKRLAVITVAVVLGLTACRDETTTPSDNRSPQLGQGSSRSISGWFHNVWGDPRGGRGSPQLRHLLFDDGGRSTELLLDQNLLAPLGGYLALNRKRIRIHGQELAPGRIQVGSLELERAAGLGGMVPAADPRIGSFPFVTIGCKFSDIAAEPHTIATYVNWTTGTAYPGLNHYWSEVSFNQLNVTGSTVVGWYTLPQPQSHYMNASGLDLNSLAMDCIGAADPDVYFPQFSGINLQFNGDLGASFGGSSTLNLDGQIHPYGMSWLSDWAELNVYAHEEGHMLGLPHSSGPYGATYDSRWDVMSDSYAFFDPVQSTYIPQHTISFHKDLLGWIPTARKLTVAPNSNQTITLERLAQPGSGNYLMAQIAIDNAPGQFYTIEARRLVGKYDSHVPGNAVVVHRVMGVGADPHDEARVVDVDNNGDPNDAGAQWTVGETFTDGANGIAVAINALTTTGFQVTIKRGAASDTWVSEAAMPEARSAFALAAGGNLLYAFGGNSNGAILASSVVYSPTTNTWTGVAAVPSARYDGNGAAVNSGLVYLAGGRDAAGKLTKTLYVYTRSTNVWSTAAALPISSGCGGSGIINGLLYVLTGCHDGYKGLLHRYNPTSNTWTALATAPAAHGYPVVGVIKGKLYVAGGRNAASTATATLDVYDPATNTWSTKAAMPSARYGAAGGIINGKLYLVGGIKSGGVLAATLVYDPATNLWSTKAPMPTARARLGAAVISNLLYAVGGETTTGLKRVEQYAP